MTGYSSLDFTQIGDPLSEGEGMRRGATKTASLSARYAATRAQTESLCEPLHTEDYVVSSMTDVSPTKWHLAHTSWFFETFVLSPNNPDYKSPDPRYAFLFNSYYVQAGERHCRAQRGLATRPTVGEVFAYRAHVDGAMQDLINRLPEDHPAGQTIEIGINHEQQHQELLLTDIKHVFWMNPLRPAYTTRLPSAPSGSALMSWVSFDEGVRHIGHEGESFSFDNELPRHRVFTDAFTMASRLITNGEFVEFIDGGGYKDSRFWLSNAWATVQAQKWEAPLYWENVDGVWREFTLAGDSVVRSNSPVCHLSYFEADAYARWAGKRLPTEAEWEIAAARAPVAGNFVEAELFHPAAVIEGEAGTTELRQLYGDAWQWTQSPYVAYPGYAPPPGAIGEYNGKWMCDQWVLRGASCATPRSHARHTYRNFFPSDARWQFAGIRLADDA